MAKAKMNDELQTELRPIIGRFGIETVSQALDQWTGRKHMRETRRVVQRKPSESRRSTAVEYVEKMGLSEEHAAVMGRAAAEFEKRSFLSTLCDIRSFCETYGIDAPKSNSRAAAIPRVFRLLQSMEAADIETVLDDRLFSGPVELGPIAEAIRGRARQNLAAAARTGEAGRQEKGDSFEPIEAWDAANAIDRHG